MTKKSKTVMKVKLVTECHMSGIAVTYCDHDTTE